MHKSIARAATIAVCGALAAATLVACSSSGGDKASSSSPSSGSATGGAGGSGVIPAAAKLVPANFKSKGTLTVGTEAQYPPFEALGSDNKTIVGFDADLAHAMGTAMGLKINQVNTSFDSIIPGMQGGKYDLGISAFTDTKEREKVVDFVTYFSEGQILMVRAGNPDKLDINDLCGKIVGDGKGGTENLIVIPALTTACQKAGKPAINEKVFSGQDAPNLALASGQIQATILDQTVGAETARKSNGKFEVTGDPIDKSPVGIAVPKSSGLTKAVQAAIQGLIENGTYKKLLAKWNVSAGAIKTSQVNVAIS